MSQFRFITFITLIYLLVLQPSTIECRPRNQRIVIGAHEWTVSDEPGWEEGNIIQIFFQKKKLCILFFSSTRS
jgi:hypothetical protein